MEKESTLKSGATVVLREKGDLTERLNRPVERAYSRSGSASMKLAGLGFDPLDKSTWGVVSQLDDEQLDNLEGYKAAVIGAMVVRWSFPQEVSAEASLDLSPEDFDELADLCNLAWRGGDAESFEVSPDPLVDTNDSTG